MVVYEYVATLSFLAKEWADILKRIRQSVASYAKKTMRDGKSIHASENYGPFNYSVFVQLYKNDMWVEVYGEVQSSLDEVLRDRGIREAASLSIEMDFLSEMDDGVVRTGAYKAMVKEGNIIYVPPAIRVWWPLKHLSHKGLDHTFVHEIMHFIQDAMIEEMDKKDKEMYATVEGLLAVSHKLRSVKREVKGMVQACSHVGGECKAVGSFLKSIKGMKEISMLRELEEKSLQLHRKYGWKGRIYEMLKNMKPNEVVLVKGANYAS